jgi:homopolymeric O-antigen transport system ATP-binding protein
MAARAIEVEGLGKRYRLGTTAHGYDTIRDAIAGAVRPAGRTDRPDREIWALRDVDFTVDAGETVGIIGRNGAGKTTLLKILARITDPTEGRGRTRGRVGALLEVGTGFHPELTGRENVFLNGAVLGVSRREVARRFDEIVEFAEVERFIDTPLKRYSAGMYLRLAFAVAAHLEPAIVMVDEVLAVGDVEFRHRCLTKMNALGDEGRTVLFVSHDLGAVTRICPRVIWLDRGLVKADGRAADVMGDYMASAEASTGEFDLHVDETAPVHPLSVQLVDAEGRPVEMPLRNQELSFRIRIQARERVPGVDVGLELFGRHGACVIATALSDEHGESQLEEPGTYDIRATIPPILAPGEYILRLWIGVRVGIGVAEDLFLEDALTFQVWPLPDDRHYWLQRGNVVQPPLDWQIADFAAATHTDVIA